MTGLERPNIGYTAEAETKGNPMQTRTQNEVIVTNIKMPFWSMVGFMIKWALAAIPAAIILLIIYAVAIAALRGILGTF